MHDATTRSSGFRLAVAPGVPSSHLSALLARQRSEEPETTIAFSEVAGDQLIAGLHGGRYDAGISLEGSADPLVQSRPLWTENLAVAIPLRSPLLGRGRITISELLDYALFWWRAERCPLLDQSLSSLPQWGKQRIQHVTSFETMALWVAAGYGIGVSAKSRLEHAHGWGICMLPLSDGPYEVVTHLQRLNGPISPAIDRFERRAQQVAKAGST